jgi:hypothetical protein
MEQEKNYSARDKTHAPEPKSKTEISHRRLAKRPDKQVALI